MQTWIAATKNKGKLREIREILENTDIHVISMEEAGITVDVEEDGETFEENAEKKAREIFKLTGNPCIADDSGLEVRALSGAPGVYSARYAGEHGDSHANNQKLLSEMEGVQDRSARFVCAMVLVLSDTELLTVRGECYGQITAEARGEGGFGYDPLFYLPEYQMTMGEVSPEIKNKISHRGKALRALREELCNRAQMHPTDD